jgi:hypothetical protein
MEFWVSKADYGLILLYYGFLVQMLFQQMIPFFAFAMIFLPSGVLRLGGGGPYCALSTSFGRLQTECPQAGRTV